jgi:hypothetical protein
MFLRFSVWFLRRLPPAMFSGIYPAALAGALLRGYSLKRAQRAGEAVLFLALRELRKQRED